MKKNKLKKIAVSCSLAFAFLPSLASAQWAVVNVNDEHYFGQLGVFTRSIAEMVNALKGAIDENTAVLDVARRQSAQNIVDADTRARAAMGQANIAQYLIENVPTLEACSAASAKSGLRGTVAASGGGASAPSGINAVTTSKTLTRELEKIAMPLNRKAELKTCSTLHSTHGLMNCPANGGQPGEFGGSSAIPPSDLTYLSLKGNTANSLKNNPATQELANYTIPADDTAYDVALQYITNATMYEAPTALTPYQAKQDESIVYLQQYDTAMLKLYAAQQAYSDIVSSRISLNLAPDSIALRNWMDKQDIYEEVMGMRMPQQPSLSEYIHSTAMMDFLGVDLKNIPKDTVGYLRAIDEKMKLQNIIASKQLQQQENTNILLAHMLTQMVTPVDFADLRRSYDEIDQTIPKVDPSSKQNEVDAENETEATE